MLSSTSPAFAWASETVFETPPPNPPYPPYPRCIWPYMSPYSPSPACPLTDGPSSPLSGEPPGPDGPGNPPPPGTPPPPGNPPVPPPVVAPRPPWNRRQWVCTTWNRNGELAYATRTSGMNI